MKRGIYFLIFFLMIFVAKSEIKLIQIKVQDAPDSRSNFSPSPLYEELPYDDQTSYVLPVKNKRIEGYRMPFIKNFGHEVLLVGPFLDVCGDIQILDANNNVKATIRSSSFVSKGRRNFWFANEWKAKKEGYVHFRITKNILNSITTKNFKIKVGPIDALDMIEGKIVERFQIQAMLFTSTPAPRREMVSDGRIRTVKNTFEPNTEYAMKIKLRGGVLRTDKFGFVLIGSTKSLLYNFSKSRLGNCIGNFSITSAPVTTKLIETNDAIEIKVKAQTNIPRFRSSESNGYLIGLHDDNIGNLTKVTINEGSGPTFGQSVSKRELPDSWGPYIYARLMSDVYTFGQYTDLGQIESGTCATNNFGSGGPTNVRIVGGSSGSQVSNSSDATILDLSYQNALIYEQNDQNISDEFPGLNMNVCRQANDPNPKITNIPSLRAVVTAPSDFNFVGSIEIKFIQNGRQVDSGTISNVNAGQSAFVEFRRPESRLCITNPPSNANICKRCGNGFQTIRHWDDEGTEIQLFQNGAFVGSITVPSED